MNWHRHVATKLVATKHDFISSKEFNLAENPIHNYYLTYVVAFNETDSMWANLVSDTVASAGPFARTTPA